MPLLPPTARARTRRLVRDTLDERVTVLGPPAETTGDYGEAVPGARPVLGTLAARVTPEAADERIAADRLDAPQAYVVRVSATAAVGDATAAEKITAQHALRWERPARLGGPVAMEITARPADDHGRGRFLDIACEVPS